MKTLIKSTTQPRFVKQLNFLNGFVVRKIWKRTNFRLFIEPILFSRKSEDQTLNCFYHYLISSATQDKINLYNKI